MSWLLGVLLFRIFDRIDRLEYSSLDVVMNDDFGLTDFDEALEEAAEDDSEEVAEDEDPEAVADEELKTWSRISLSFRFRDFLIVSLESILLSISLSQ